MKFSFIFFFSTILISTLNFSVFAEESKVCEKTLKAICSETKGHRRSSQKYLNGFKKAFVKQTKSKVSKKTDEKVESAKSIVKEMYALISNDQNTSMFKNYMYQAIDESPFDDAIRFKFKQTIGSVLVGNYSEFYQEGDPRYKNLVATGERACGVEGLEINAFSTQIYEQKYVFFCPGFLIELSQIKDEQERLNAILLMMSHELAHHIDTKLLGEKIYMPYLSCMSENYSNEFKKTKTDESFCKKKTTSQSTCNMKTTLSHAKELIADQWAIKVLAIHAKTQRFTVGETDLFLKRNYVNICETATEGIHPTGDFRIEKLLRINPEISDYLSCNNSEIAKPACTFDGAVNL